MKIILGYAPWSTYEMELIQTIKNVEIFNIGECKSHEDIWKNMPGIGHVDTTPIAAVYDENGILQEKVIGLWPIKKLLEKHKCFIETENTPTPNI